MNFDGSDLVFIACQPRSGSTLLQRMLGGHPAVHTVSEPWIMLPSAYTLKGSGMDAEYDAQLAQTGIRTFWESLPEGRDDYVEGMRRMYGFLYQRALETTDARFFLDKTPRYYLILSELKEIFPEARFILLLRNPLAVLSSILRTWVGKQWTRLERHKEDLLKAPGLILDAIIGGELDGKIIHYEDLVRNPQSGVARICEYLGIEVEPNIVEYESDDQEKWTLGDPNSIYNHSTPQTKSLDKWTHPDDAQQWRLMSDYMSELGEDTFEALGYEFDECRRKLEAVRPSQSKLRYTASLNWLLEYQEQSPSYWRRHKMQVLNAMREGGAQSVARYAASRVKSKFI